jgi:hypothetical protein
LDFESTKKDKRVGPMQSKISREGQLHMPKALWLGLDPRCCAGGQFVCPSFDRFDVIGTSNIIRFEKYRERLFFATVLLYILKKM